MKINAYRSADKRLKTEPYSTNGGKSFSLAEHTGNGTLITEFKPNGEVLNQVYVEKKDAANALSEYLADFAEIQISDTGAYERVKVDATCTKCGESRIERELDQHSVSGMLNIPVVPIFICKKCGTKFYSMSDEYLKHLVSRKEALFSADEIAEKSKGDGEFVGMLQSYIIRIFASKKIHKLNIKA